MKICPCKKNLIREEVESIACYDSCTSSIIDIVESDCVCSKSKSEEALDAFCNIEPSKEPPTEAIIFKLGDNNSGGKWNYCDQCDQELTEEDKTYCKKCLSLLSEGKFIKQSQSPCEHEWKAKFMVTDVRVDSYGSELTSCVDSTAYMTKQSFWCCFKCGLVTCKNPNQG